MDLMKSINEAADIERGPEISVKHDGIGRGYTAIDNNSYGGVDDGPKYIGHGENHFAAVEDLINQLDAAKIYSEDVLNHALEDYHISTQAEIEDERKLGIQDERPRVEYQ